MTIFVFDSSVYLRCDRNLNADYFHWLVSQITFGAPAFKNFCIWEKIRVSSSHQSARIWLEF